MRMTWELPFSIRARSEGHPPCVPEGPPAVHLFPRARVERRESAHGLLLENFAETANTGQ